MIISQSRHEFSRKSCFRDVYRCYDRLHSVLSSAVHLAQRARTHKRTRCVCILCVCSQTHLSRRLVAFNLNVNFDRNRTRMRCRFFPLLSKAFTLDTFSRQFSCFYFRRCDNRRLKESFQMRSGRLK